MNVHDDRPNVIDRSYIMIEVALFRHVNVHINVVQFKLTNCNVEEYGN